MPRDRFGRASLAAFMLILLTAAAASLRTTRAAGSPTNAAQPVPKASIVLVHGAFADGSGWKNVIPLLERDGYYVIAVQNPLTSTPEDIANTRRVIDAQTSPVVLVGHSYGGVVITGAAVNNPKVKALVYIAAFAPDTNEAIGPLLEKYPSMIGASLRPDSGGYLYIDRAMFREVFAADISVPETKVMAATQKPINQTAFKATLDAAAWRTLPTWYLVAQDDHAINPNLERFFAKRMGATTSEVKASHVAFLSQPAVVATLIEQAATAAVKPAVARRPQAPPK
jgi:pimeloyl-ACP methyl ester carboxylesterase